MESWIAVNVLAREIARERTMMRREPLVLEYPPTVLRSVVTSVRSVASTINRIFEMPLEQATYCAYNPAVCRGS